MIDVVLRLILQVQGGNSIGDKIHIDDVNFVIRSERKHCQARQEHVRLHHIELSRLCMAAVAKDDARAEDGLRRVGKQNASHMFTEFLRAGVGIIVGTIPFDRLIFGDNLVAAFPCNRYRADFAEAGQAVVMLSVTS